MAPNVMKSEYMHSPIRADNSQAARNFKTSRKRASPSQEFEENIKKVSVVELSSRCESVRKDTSHEKDEVESPEKNMVTKDDFVFLKETVHEMSKVVTNLHRIIMKNHSKSRAQADTAKKISPPNDNHMLANSCRQLFVPHARDKFADCYINYNRMNTVLYDGRSTGITIPEWIPVVFKPPTRMILDEVDAGLVAYIFGRNKDVNREEILIDTRYMTGNRETLRCLIPNEMIDDKVISLVACMLSFKRKEARCWFLPTDFATLVLTWTRQPDRLMELFKSTFLGNVEGLRKIFVPIHDGKLHWFLLVIDIKRKALTLLDSAKSPTTFYERRRIVHLLANFMQQMLEDKSFYQQHGVTEKPKLSEFNIVEPNNIGQQAPGSNDCGIWVATWMRDSIWDDSYNIQVNAETRMRLAIDLVNHPYNKLNDQVITLAMQNWENLDGENKKLVKMATQ